MTNYINQNPDLVILGNSRAEASYNDSIISSILNINCVNLGWSGYPFDYQYHVMWKTYLKNNHYPRYVILEVGPWAFLDYVNPIYITELLPYINRPEFQFYINLCPELSWIDNINVYKYRGKIRHIYEEYKEMQGQGQTKENTMKRWNSKYIGTKRKLEKDPLILSLLHTFFDECSQNNVIPIIICSPMHITDGSSYFAMDSFWEIINCNIPDEIYVLNYQDLYGNDTTFFHDPMHLNKIGKETFSIKIAHDLDSIGIIK
ncbi:MAG: hypothetical protein IKR52_01265 [Paludibacteraceae bacterium]|nr:hypothetical protein [Paludibacteraceae bacterium]